MNHFHLSQICHRESNVLAIYLQNICKIFAIQYEPAASRCQYQCVSPHGHQANIFFRCNISNREDINNHFSNHFRIVNMRKSILSCSFCLIKKEEEYVPLYRFVCFVLSRLWLIWIIDIFDPVVRGLLIQLDLNESREIRPIFCFCQATKFWLQEI